MLTLKICLLLWICVYVNADDDGSNSVDLECKDKLPDCFTLATEEFCQSDNQVSNCARSCGLCANEASVFNHIARSRSRQAVRARPSRPANSRTRSKPAVVRHDRNREHLEPVQQKIDQNPELEQQSPEPDQQNHDPTRKTVRVPQPRNKSPTRSKPRTQQQPRELGRGTIEGSAPAFQSGTIVQMPADVRPLSELAETKTAFLKVSLKAHSVANSCGHLMGGSQQTAEYADGGSSSAYARFVVHMQARWSSEKQWVTKLREVVDGSEKVVKETGEIKQEMESIVSRMQKHLDYFKNRPNIAKSLASFSSDFDRTVNTVKKIESTLIPTKDTLADILKNAESAQNNEEEMKKVVQKLKDATATFGNLENEAKALEDELTKVGKDFESSVGAISSQKGDIQSVREPESPKSFEPKNEKEPNQQPSNNGGSQQSNNDNKQPSNENKQPDQQQPGKENKQPDQQQPGKQPSSNDNKQTEETKMGTIQCKSDGYLANDNGKLKCSSTLREEFRVILVNGQQVKLETKENKYCEVLTDETLSCTAENSGPNMLFGKVDNGDGTVSIKCPNQKYLSAPSKDQVLSCSVENPSANEKFTMDPNQPQPKPNNEQQTPSENSAEEQLKKPGTGIRCPFDKVMVVEQDNLLCKKAANKGDKFHIVKLDGNNVNLHAGGINKYCSMGVSGTNPLKCTSDQPDANGKFEMQENSSGGYFSLKCPNGKVLTNTSGKDQVSCNGEGNKRCSKV
ncbi:hypothetical protein M3Y97_00646900 [Aphelenchoides bicaudatus]|nr:hypothetical protein M3Y97_00646900 [Aphelenchoides bicaudatus]